MNTKACLSIAYQNIRRDHAGNKLGAKLQMYVVGTTPRSASMPPHTREVGSSSNRILDACLFPPLSESRNQNVQRYLVWVGLEPQGPGQ